MPRALLSVSNKTGLAEFGRGLLALGFELVSTGGTSAALAKAGLPVRSVSDVTRFPEMLGGRVKTLHPAVHGGILARRDEPGDLEALASQGITTIDLVAVNLYPFAEAAANPNTTPPDLVEEIDIGGPTMVRSSAKNFKDVLIVVDPSDYARVLEALEQGKADLALRLALAQKAFAHTGRYDALISSTLREVRAEGTELVRGEIPRELAFPGEFSVGLAKVRDLRYGENPHQLAAWYSESNAGFGRVEILQGRELSYTNLLDLDAAARIVLEFSEPAASIIKHTNPCGVAVGATIAEAYVTAREADALSAFGGIIGLNRPLDEETANAIATTFIEAVVAPAVEPAALAVLAAKPNLRVVRASFEAFSGAAPTYEVRSILGGVLVQQRDRVAEAAADWADEASRPEGLRVVTERQPTADEWRALRFAWRVCAHVKSNTVLFTEAGRTRAIGAGQMSRVDAVNVAVLKAGAALEGSVAASDAFFPFRDGLDAVARAGAKAVIQPGGSMRDAEVIAAANEHGLTMVFTGRRHFRH